MADPIPAFPPMPEDRFYRAGFISGVVDGDTIDARIDAGWSLWLHERLRLESVNTPETKGAEKLAGRFVKDLVASWLPEGTAVRLASTVFDRTGRARGKYGRTVALVYHAEEGWCLNQRLLQQKLAWLTDDDGSLVGERSLAALTGLPADLRGG
jgi:micrococcal nuclease